jgi:NADH:ubiquinone oxidoreductase subunit H
MVGVAFLNLLERRVLGYIHIRTGPKYRSVFSIVKFVFVVTENIDRYYVYIINKRKRYINDFIFEGINVLCILNSIQFEI